MQKNDHIFINNLQIKKKKQQKLKYTDEYNEQRLSALNEISPIWAKRLKEIQSIKFLISLKRLQWLFEIIQAKKCVVGEAHGFSSSYTTKCKECARIGNKFSLYFSICHSKKLEENQKRFVKHWNEKHLKKS